VKALREAVKEGGEEAMCFNPRHRLVAKKKNPAKNEAPEVRITICFECSQAEIAFVGGKTRHVTVPHGKKWQEPFDKVLRDAGVALGKP
jgi:hypothetical protein